MRLRAAMLSPARALPSAAADSPAAGFSTQANLFASIPTAHFLSSGALAPAFSRLSVASLAYAFAPFSAAGPGLACAGPPSRSTFRAEMVPGNALARGLLSPRARPHSLDNTCLRNTWIMFVFPSHPSEIFLFC